MSAKKSIEKFGERALNAIIKEYEQFENLSVFTPVDASTLPFDVPCVASTRVMACAVVRQDGFDLELKFGIMHATARGVMMI